MSNFSIYAQRLDELARRTFQEITEKEEAYQKAEQVRKEAAGWRNSVNPEYVAKWARTEAGFQEAKNDLDNMRRNLPDTTAREAGSIRAELEQAINGAFAADPAQIDMATLELLKSGILRGTEYGNLLEKEERAGNATMARLIGRFAKDAADELAKNGGQHDPDAVILRSVAHKARSFSGKDYLEAFDTMQEILARSVKNSHLIPMWDSFTSETISNF